MYSAPYPDGEYGVALKDRESYQVVYGCPHSTNNPDTIAATNYDNNQPQNGYYSNIFKRRCPYTNPLQHTTSTFGNAEEDTADIAIGALDDDFADLVTVSGRDHVRVYRGTASTEATGDFSPIVPETFAAPNEQAVATHAAMAESEGRRLGEPYSQFPGGAARGAELANARQVVLADFDADGRTDIFLHAPAPSAGSCAMRCHAERRFGFDSFEVRHTHAAADDEAAGSWCYCGPHYDLMIGCAGRFEPAQPRAPDAPLCFS